MIYDEKMNAHRPEKKEFQNMAEQIAREIMSLPANEIKEFISIIRTLVHKEFIERCEKAKHHAAQTTGELEIIQTI